MNKKIILLEKKLQEEKKKFMMRNCWVSIGDVFIANDCSGNIIEVSCKKIRRYKDGGICVYDSVWDEFWVVEWEKEFKLIEGRICYVE
jgi:hypothetical protein